MILLRATPALRLVSVYKFKIMQVTHSFRSSYQAPWKNSREGMSRDNRLSVIKRGLILKRLTSASVSSGRNYYWLVDEAYLSR